MAGAAAFVSFFLVGTGMTPYTVGGLALVWGAVALVSTASVIAGAVLTSLRRGRTMPDFSPEQQASAREPAVTHIIRELPT